MRKFFKTKTEQFYIELSGYSKQEKIFIFFAMLCGFLICCDYSIIRPISNSLFISTYSSQWLPFAWVAIVPFNYFLVHLYNRLIPKWGSKSIFTALLVIVGFVNCFVAFFSKKIFTLPFMFYIWKELYVLLFFQLLWSVIHSNIQFKKAKYLYGVLFGVGGLGSMFGTCIPGFLATLFGSESLLLASLPVYGALWFTYRNMCVYSKGDFPLDSKEEKGGFIQGIRLIRNSRFLIFALLIVLFMQVISATTDFQFNSFLEQKFEQKDLRTEFSARIFGIVHTLTVIFQFIGSYFFIQKIGFQRSHYLIPFCIAFFGSLFIIFPIFSFASLLFIFCKSFDFSLFGVMKEMLYIPLKPEEKFQAKAVIDVFVYRSSKAVASILILLSNLISFSFLPWLIVFLAFIWIASVSYVFKGEESSIKEVS